MTGAVALLAVAALATAPDLLEQARTAFAAGDYPRAEALALEAAAPPNAAAALYLAGLARFRAGRPAEALDAIDRAGPGADAPGAYHHNRAACLYELGRWREAEAEYLAAADADGSLAAVALANAGFAALEQGAVDRARAHADRARAVAEGPAAALVTDLDAELAGGRDAEAAGAPARTRPGASSPVASRWGVDARAEGGWDSNALQTGVAPAPLRPVASSASAGSTGSGVATSRLALSRRFALGASGRGEAAVGIDQLAYAGAPAEDRSVQQDGISLRAEVDTTDRLRIGAAVDGQLAYAGLSAFRPMQGQGGVRLWTSLDEGERTTTHLELGWARKEGLAAEFEYLTGDRVDAGLSQELRLGPARLSAGVRVLRDDLGSVAGPPQAVPPSPLCPDGCTAQALQPLGFEATGAWVSARAALGARLSLELSVGGEWRRYLADDAVVLFHHDGGGATTSLGRREERRLFTGALATVRLTTRLSLLLRHELLVDRSTLPATPATTPMMGFRGGDAASRRDDGRGYEKQVFTAGAVVAW